MKSLHRALIGCALSLMVAIGAGAQAYQDESYTPTVDEPAFAKKKGPVVLLDEAHNNYHTCEGRYRVFCELLENDGFIVKSNKAPLSAKSLKRADVLVIANALNAQNVTDDENWKTPILPAFSKAEIDAVEQWVAEGGSLLLVSDHMPFPGAIANMASRFGVVWQNAFAFAADFDFAHPKGNPNMINFGLSADASGGIGHAHPIFQGRNPGAAAHSVTSFTGSAFRLKPNSGVQPLLELGEGTMLLYPMASQEQTMQTPNASGVGLLQGAVLERGEGRVAFMGEAAMFSARLANFISPGFKMGINNSDAPYNKQFTLNLFHWLSNNL
ncbi:MAG: hypothetical protein ACKVJG_06010 [Candidatus Latescibacterota bacterium]|jgi:hypothetical protein